MRPFTYDALPARVVFGSGTLAQLPAEIARLGCRRALILSTAQQAGKARELDAALGTLSAGIFAGAVMHTPTDVTGKAVRVAADLAADCVVALGGGSTIGLGKAIALVTDLPQIALPTTYAGSEVTPILGQTADGRKTTIRDLKVLPETVIYDVDLTLTLPYALSVTSGINAIAHAAEALYAKDGNPLLSRLAEDGVRALAGALRRLKVQPADLEARSDALFGAWACGTCLGAAGMALHHKLCHVLGGTFNLPHAETHTVILPHALAYNAGACPEEMARLAAALGVAQAPSGLFDLIGELGGPRSLKELGFEESQIDRAVDAALTNAYWNPRPLEAVPLRALLERAYRGESP